MMINKAGTDLVKSFESCRLTSYPDPGTGGDPWTIGWGHTGGVRPGQVISQDMADTMLLRDLAKFEDGVARLIKVPVTSNQFSACVSFAYNCGLENFAGSTLLKKINGGDPSASQEFSKWVNANGKVMAGLVKRRAAEKALFDLD